MVDIYECKKTGFIKAVIKLAERHTIEKNISDIIIDNEFIEGLDPKTVRTLTYMATVERLKPDYSIVVQQMTHEVDEYILEIKSKKDGTTIKKSSSELSKNPDLIAKFHPLEANRIGYMAGVCETAKEYQMIRQTINQECILRNTIFETLSRRKQYKYPYFFLGLYLTFLLSTVCLASRITQIGSMLVPGGIFVFPITFCICDIVGEVYGYAYPRLFIWIGILSEFVFSLILIGVSHLPAPQFFNSAEAYQIVFDPTIRYVVSGLVGLLVGELTNVYLLAKWKIFLKGKFFIFRSLLSTAFGQALLTIIVDMLNYYGKLSDHNLGWMMLCGYFWKMCCALLWFFPPGY